MKSKNKKNTVWIVFTCIFALTTVVLAMALYRSHSTLEAVRVQLAEYCGSCAGTACRGTDQYDNRRNESEPATTCRCTQYAGGSCYERHTSATG